MATPDEQAATMIANYKEKTGKTLGDWLKVIGKSGLEKHGEIVKMLKTDHGMTHGFANLAAMKFRDPSVGEKPAAGAEDALVTAQYAGKDALKPIYDKLIAEISKFGADVELAPKKAYVSLRRSKQFGLIQPSTKTRLDVGLNLKGVAPEGRLEASGSFNAMCSHRVRLETPKDVDTALIGWLKAAYDKA